MRHGAAAPVPRHWHPGPHALALAFPRLEALPPDLPLASNLLESPLCHQPPLVKSHKSRGLLVTVFPAQ